MTRFANIVGTEAGAAVAGMGAFAAAGIAPTIACVALDKAVAGALP